MKHQLQAAREPDLAEQLRHVPVLADLTAEEMSWLASHMTTDEYRTGDALSHEGDPADRMIVVLKGEIRGTHEYEPNDGLTYTARAGDITGKLPYSRMHHFPLTTRALEPVEIASLPASRCEEMQERMPKLGARLVGVLADRVRETTRNEQQSEKMVALGRLSAGLAHELNNPAAAARRSAEHLRETLCSLRTAAVSLALRDLSLDQRRWLFEIERAWEEKNHSASMDTLERSDREQEIGAWLDERGVAEAWTLAPDLVEAGAELAVLKEIETRFDQEALSDVVTRLAGSFTITRLSKEIESSTARISELVRAIKEYSYMDQMPEQRIDVHAGLENTLIMLHHRLKRGVNVVRQYDRTLPQICAFGSELNQVWTNLIENAIDAMNDKGELRVRTGREPNGVLVEIGDNGPGIPPGIIDRIYDPFFTTKPVGQGTGLGLDTVRRIVRKHRGSIDVESKPGDTRFQVRLPIPKNGEQA
jgi:signal transduction histidine kinase